MSFQRPVGTLGSQNADAAAITGGSISGVDLDAGGHTIRFGSAEMVAVVSANTCTVDLSAGNHWTIPVDDADSDLVVILTVPPGPSAGRLLFRQGTTARRALWACSSGSIDWFGDEPDYTVASKTCGISWTWDGSTMWLSATQTNSGYGILTSYTDDLASIYSVCRLLKSYTGPCLKVRRSSDNAELDIGWVGNELDTAALLAHVGAGSGYVVTWYDQSGNESHATAATDANEPRIVNAGVLDVADDGRAQLVFNGSSNLLISAKSTTLAQSFIIGSFAGAAASGVLLASAYGNNSYHGFVASAALLYINDSSTIASTSYRPNSDRHLFRFTYGTTSIHQDGVSLPLAAPQTTIPRAGAIYLGRGLHESAYLEGSMQLAIVYTAVQASAAVIDALLNNQFRVYETAWTALAENAASALIIPTFDANTNVTHPSVIDMGIGEEFGGYRYWMAFTPFPGAERENPSIVSSQDGTTWVVPDGLTDPIDPAPTSPAYNSDTCLFLDGDTLYCVWREYTGATSIFKYRSTTDGVTWTDEGVVLGSRAGGDASPVIAKVDDTYHLFFVGTDVTPSALYHATASAITGPWSTPSVCLLHAPPGRELWHISVTHDTSAIPWKMIASTSTYSDANDKTLWYATSLDGDEWDFELLLSRGAVGTWDTSQIYHGSLAGDVLFYAGITGSTWRIGRTAF